MSTGDGNGNKGEVEQAIHFSLENLPVDSVTAYISR